MREIILDTETTGLDPKTGHRIVEIGCIEMVGRSRTGRHFHAYINPERDMPEEAFNIHGISGAFLLDKPKFSEIAHDFIEFIADAQLVIHNAQFDVKFINFEFGLIKKPIINQALVIDTLYMARKKFPGSPASLDALCKRFKIDLSSREKHGALLDAELLADVYVQLTGGSQNNLFTESKAQEVVQMQKGEYRAPREFKASEQELEAHKEFMMKIKQPIWNG